MNVLGISCNGPNPAAALVMDGRLVAMAEEERFVRIKTAPTHFPSNAVDYCLNQGELELKDIDRVACAWDANKYVDFMPSFYAGLGSKYGDKGRLTDFSQHHILNFYHPEFMKLRIQGGLTHGRRSGPVPEITFLQHHLCHAASTFYCSGFEESAVLTVDGSGEEQSTVLWKGDRSGLTQLESVDLPHSFGWLYAAITEFLGFRPYSDEGSVMGLACYGGPVDEIESAFDRIVRITDSGSEIDPYLMHFGEHQNGARFTDRLLDLLGPNRFRNDPILKKHENIAWSLQNKLEQSMIGLLTPLMHSAGSRNLCLAGGVALNCKMNQVLRNSTLVDNIFIQPASSDAGTALGAAMIISHEKGFDPFAEMTHAYWGPEFTNDQIQISLDNLRLSYKQSSDIAADMAKRISQGEIVGWFQGRAEIGPRALGSRSILANPLDESTKDRLNDAVKYREPWRPFAPSILEHHAADYLVNPVLHPFMILTFDVVESKAVQIPAVVHVDQTVRPQTVKQADNPLYYRLIQEFESITRVPMVLNTSFNVKGEPVVNSVEDAVRCFYGSGLNSAAIGDFILEKPS